MQSYMLEGWRIRDVEQKASRAEGRLHELGTIQSTVDRLEHTVRELRAELDGLRNEFQASQEQHSQNIADIRGMLLAFMGMEGE